MKGYGVGYTGNEHSFRTRKFEGGVEFISNIVTG
jgi:hypothetical protein